MVLLAWRGTIRSMRPPSRHLLTALSVLSLLLSMAVCVLWMRSRKVHDRIQRVGFTTESAECVSLTSTGGRIGLFACTSHKSLFASSPAGCSIALGAPRDPTVVNPSTYGFALDHRKYRTPVRINYISASIPHGLVTAITFAFGVTPLTVSWYRRKCVRQGFCLTSGVRNGEAGAQ
jgi:hypothetical protein